MSLWLDESIKSLLVLADKFNKPLFELAPDIFPDGYLTEVEKLLWLYYYEQKAKVINKNG